MSEAISSLSADPQEFRKLLRLVRDNQSEWEKKSLSDIKRDFAPYEEDSAGNMTRGADEEVYSCYIVTTDNVVVVITVTGKNSYSIDPMGSCDDPETLKKVSPILTTSKAGNRFKDWAHQNRVEILTHNQLSERIEEKVRKQVAARTASRVEKEKDERTFSERFRDLFGI